MRPVRSLASHSMTSSASASNVGGTSRPSIRAVLTLMANSNLVRCLCRQITRIGTFQDAIDIRRRALKNIGGLRSVGDQGTFADELPIGENRRNAMLRCRADDQIAMYDGIGVRRNEQATAGSRPSLAMACSMSASVHYGSRLDLQRTRWRNSLE